MQSTHIIKTLWNGKDLALKDQVSFSLANSAAGIKVGEIRLQQSHVKVSVQAPFYNDPRPPAASGSACDGLWDFEGLRSLDSRSYASIRDLLPQQPKPLRRN
jgi:hypothetical protein